MRPLTSDSNARVHVTSRGIVVAPEGSATRSVAVPDMRRRELFKIGSGMRSEAAQLRCKQNFMVGTGLSFQSWP